MEVSIRGKKQLQPATLVKATLLHGCFLRFLNFTNGTNSRNASQILIISAANTMYY